MNYFFKPHFARLFKKLEPLKQKQIIAAIEALKVALEAGQKPEGLGLKRLNDNLWEMRSSLKDRILFTLDKDIVSFVLVGNHDDILKYLKNF